MKQKLYCSQYFRSPNLNTAIRSPHHLFEFSVASSFMFVMYTQTRSSGISAAWASRPEAVHNETRRNKAHSRPFIWQPKNVRITSSSPSAILPSPAPKSFRRVRFRLNSNFRKSSNFLGSHRTHSGILRLVEATSRAPKPVDTISQMSLYLAAVFV